MKKLIAVIPYLILALFYLTLMISFYDRIYHGIGGSSIDLLIFFGLYLLIFILLRIYAIKKLLWKRQQKNKNLLTKNFLEKN